MNSLLRSFKYAFRGIFTGLASGRNQKIHALAAFFAISAALYCGLSGTEYCVLALTISAVFSAELFNSAIEELCDEICKGERRPSIERIKDMSAAAVLVTAIASLFVAFFLFAAPLLKK
ncbi:MAG TPA: diacylglycerol kinase family protein [Candidatus Wallbacteria bacterium]|nr:diacylglycerol kinase family protein [Candidatus Wallbacteria bacterium]